MGFLYFMFFCLDMLLILCYALSLYLGYLYLSDCQNVLTFTFFNLKKLDVIPFSFKWLYTV